MVEKPRWKQKDGEKMVKLCEIEAWKHFRKLFTHMLPKPI
jgi:hypothetical protein